MQTLSSFRSFERPVQVVLANMLANNIGFYMIVPFLAGYMAGDLGLALWVVGLILGIRTLSQQGMSLVGGAIADRIGYKPAIVAGCLLRTAAFVLFGLVDSAVGLTVAAILIGLGGALMMPAIRAYLSHGAGNRRVEAYSLLEMTQHGGSLLGPLIGSLLIGIDFRLVSFAAAVIFLGVGFLQLRYLPTGDALPAPVPQPILQSWLVPLRNRPFVLLCLSVLGLFFLYNQVYLGLPLEVRRVTGSESSVGLLFTMLAVVGIFGQVPVTRWADRTLRAPVSIALGLLLMGLAFVPLLLTAEVVPVSASTVRHWANAVGMGALEGAIAAIAGGVSLLPLALCCLLLVLGQMLAVPFIAALIPSLSAGRLLGTYFGMYALVQGIGAAFGNLIGGASLELGRAALAADGGGRRCLRVWRRGARPVGAPQRAPTTPDGDAYRSGAGGADPDRYRRPAADAERAGPPNPRVASGRSTKICQTRRPPIHHVSSEPSTVSSGNSRTTCRSPRPK